MKVLEKLVQIFKDNGYIAYGVGGCVRDYILGRPIHDFDVTTNAHPEQIKSLFKEYRVETIGEKFGTIGIYFKGYWIECTTFRSDYGFSDFRHPELIKFGESVEEDVNRRDFTMNGLLYDNGSIIDLVNGVEDINQKLIRTIGDPFKRFQEDALRIIRGLRFSSELGFSIEKKTKSAMFQRIDLLKFISKERISVEIKRLVMGSYVNNVDKELLSLILGQPINNISLQKTYIGRLKRLSPNVDTINILFTNKERKYIDLINNYKNQNLIKISNKHGIDSTRVLADYLGIDFDETKIISLSDLAIKGEHLIDQQIDEKKRGILLQLLLDEVIDGKIENELLVLIERIKQWKEFN